jgi:hypothetical protein
MVQIPTDYMYGDVWRLDQPESTSLLHMVYQVSQGYPDEGKTIAASHAKHGRCSVPYSHHLEVAQYMEFPRERTGTPYAAVVLGLSRRSLFEPFRSLMRELLSP